MKNTLLVEDLPETREWLSKLLGEAFPDVNIVSCGTVAQAIRAAGSGSFDLAIVDLELPDGSGVQVIAELARQSENITIVVATIFDDDRHIFPALQAGAQGYLLKDQPAPFLIRQLRGILDGHPPLSPAIARRLLGHFRSPVGAVANADLTAREREVLALIARGIKIADIAIMLGISHHTAGDHVKSIYRKLNISSRAQAATEASRLGLLS